jgi:hypothetical protein
MLATYREISRSVADESMREFPEVVAACVEVQRGHPELAERLLAPIADEDDPSLGQSDLNAVRALMRMQLGNVDDAVQLLTRAYAVADDDGPAMALGSRLALGYAAAHQPEEALRIVGEVNERVGGTYSDRMLALWAESLARAQLGTGDARAGVDAANAIATATDAPLEHAIAAVARAHVLEAIGDPDAADATVDAQRQLAGLALDAHGWTRLFEHALSEVTRSLA